MRHGSLKPTHTLFILLLLAVGGGSALEGATIPGYVESTLVSGLFAPTAIDFLPGGEMLVTEQGGTLSLVTNGVAAPLITIPESVAPESGGDQPLTGKKLQLKVSPVKLLKVQSKDAVAAGFGADDPTLYGGSVRVSGLGPFDTTYDLPAEGWSVIQGSSNPYPADSPPGGYGGLAAAKGYRYKDPSTQRGPISLVVILNGKMLKVIGKGEALGHTIGEFDPSPVDVVVTTGSRRFCMQFGGTASLKPNMLFTAKDAPAPSACPAP